MRIMVVNDDGIESDGIRRLAGMAAELGEVWVVAPRHQCSAMSHCITVWGSLHVKEESFPVPGVKAYSVDGTPADCVKEPRWKLCLMKFRQLLFLRKEEEAARLRIPICCRLSESFWQRK